MDSPSPFQPVRVDIDFCHTDVLFSDDGDDESAETLLQTVNSLINISRLKFTDFNMSKILNSTMEKKLELHPLLNSTNTTEITSITDDQQVPSSQSQAPPTNPSQPNTIENHEHTALPFLSTNPASVPTERSTPTPTETPGHSGDDVVQVYDDKGNVLLTKKLSRHQASKLASLDPTKVRGPRCENYNADAQARATSRLHHLDGFRKKMRDLKMVTKDDTVRIYYKDYGTSKCRVKKFATNLELLGLSQQVPSDAIADVSLPGSSTKPTLHRPFYKRFRQAGNENQLPSGSAPYVGSRMEPKRTKSLMVRTITISGLGASILSKRFQLVQKNQPARYGSILNVMTFICRDMLKE